MPTIYSVLFAITILVAAVVLELAHAFHSVTTFPKSVLDRYARATTFQRMLQPSSLTCAAEQRQQPLAATQEETILIHDAEMWSAYHDAMLQVMNQKRVLKKSDSIERPQTLLLMNKVILSVNSTTLISSRDLFHQHFSQQRESFLAATGFTSAQYTYYTRCLAYFGDVCAKRKDVGAARVAWSKLAECGMLPLESCVCAYLYVATLPQLSTLPFADTNDHQYDSLPLQIAHVHDVLYAPNEKTVTLRIKALVARGDARAAEDLLESLPCKSTNHDNSSWKRLRTFQPILDYYCQQLDVDNILKMYRQMRESDGVFLEAETYVTVLDALARAKCFVKASDGPELLNDLVLEMAEDVLELTENLAQKLQAGLEASCDASTNFFGRVTIDDKTAVCPATGAKLRLFALTEVQRRHVHDTLLQMAASQYEEFGEKLEAKGKTQERSDGGDYARTQLFEFSEWLSNRPGNQPFTAIVDGPNVAYYGHGDIHFSQIMGIVKTLEALGEVPLVLMPHKYVQSKFFLGSLRRVQELTQKDEEALSTLLSQGKLYTVPIHCLDDYYWMLASVAKQPEATTRQAGSNEKQEGFPGIRPMLVTNDQMRDHRLSLLEPREFRRWTSCHIVNYHIAPYVDNEWEDREYRLFPADFFSREIQGNAHPTQRGTVWHFPVTDWPASDRFCVFLSQKQ
jgi:hypothetical protein